MQYLIYIFSFISILCSETIHIPADYATIQSGIDASDNGDTVLVSHGTYNENLIIEKSIVLASNAIFDDLSNGWIINNNGVYEVGNPNIQSTIIDGYNLENPQSVILINSPPGNPCIMPEIFGFTITDGSGTIVLIDNGDGSTSEQNMGGGIFVNNALPIINYNFIKDCNCGERECSIQSGGAIQQSTGANFPTFMDIEVAEYRCEGDLDYSNNMFYNNEASYGSSFDSDGFTGYIDMTDGYFDVYANNEQDVSEYWVNFDDDLENIDLEDGYGFKDAISQDVWVSVNGSNDNSGLTEDEAFATIKHAIQNIYTTENNPVNIYLTEGVFGPGYSAEGLTINMLSNTNLIGQGPSSTILNYSQSNRRVIKLIDTTNNLISNLTITGGSTYYDGGGIYIARSNPTLSFLHIKNNYASYFGGGIYIRESSPILDSLIISNNESELEGGGIYMESSNPTIINSIISENICTTGINIGGDVFGGNGAGMSIVLSSTTLQNVLISNNIARAGGGVSIYTNEIINSEFNSDWNVQNGNEIFFNNITLTENNALDYAPGIMIMCNTSFFNISNSILWNNNSASLFYTDWPYTYGAINDASLININYTNFDTIYKHPNILGEFEQNNNISLDPIFTNPSNFDYTLSESSPCIDAGTVDLNNDGYPDITNYYGLAPDIGAFEYGFCNTSMGDLNIDGLIDISDIIQMVNIIMGFIVATEDQQCRSDMNQDGTTDIFDVIIMVNIILEG